MIKKLSPSDFPDLESARAFGYTDGWNKEMLLSAYSASRLLGFKEQENDNILGFIHYSTAFPEADIDSVFVFPEFRGKKIANGLMDYTLNELRQSGFNSVFLEVRISNGTAINLYKKCGFKVIGERKKYYQDGENALVMKKEF